MEISVRLVGLKFKNRITCQLLLTQKRIWSNAFFEY